MPFWEEKQHPRGGDPKNPGRFSPTAGKGPARQQYARHYHQIAASKYEEMYGDKAKAWNKDPKAARLKFVELQQKKKAGKKLTRKENLQFQEAKNTVRTSDPLQLAGFALGAVSGSMLYGSSSLIGAGAAQGRSGTGIYPAAAGALGLGASAAIAHHGYNKGRGDILGVSGFHRDGILSDAEANSMSAAGSLMAVAGLLALDAKANTNLSRIALNRFRGGAVSRNLVPSVKPVTKMSWQEGQQIAAPSYGRQTMNFVKANGGSDNVGVVSAALLRSQQALDRDLRAIGVPSNFNLHYHGNPFKDGGPRVFQFDAEKSLGIEDALVGHFRAMGALTTGNYGSGLSNKKIQAAQQLQYKHTQQFFKDVGVTHIDVTRGMALSRKAVKAHGVNPIESLEPEETPWVRGSVKLQPLNSFSVSPAMAVDYATDSVGGLGSWGSGNCAMIIRARVPVESVYGFTGFGPGHGSEIVVKGGWLDDVEMMVIDPKKLSGSRFSRITGHLGNNARNNNTAQQIQKLWDWDEPVSKSAFGVDMPYLVSKADPLTPTQVKRRKGIQAHISETTGALGLGSLGAFTAAKLGGKSKVALRAQKAVPKLKKINPDKATNASVGMSAAAGGIGGVGAFNFARYTKAEADKGKKPVSKSIVDFPLGGEVGHNEENISKAAPEPAFVPRRREPVVKSATTSAFGVDHVGKAYDSERSRMKRADAYKTTADVGAGALASGAGVQAHRAKKAKFLRKAPTETSLGYKTLRLSGGRQAASAAALGGGAVLAGASGQAIKRKKSGSWS